MIRFLPRVLAACMALLLAAGCDDVSTTVVCEGAMVPSVLVNVVNTARQPVPSTGTWISGTLSDSLRHLAGSTERLAAYGPAGIYTVRVQASGAVPWIANNVNVTQGQCGPSTVYLEVTVL